MYYIFDLDGTLANIEHRLKFINGIRKNWDAFYEACDMDKPILNNINLLITLRSTLDSEDKIIILSGRSMKVYNKTVNWLRDFGITVTDGRVLLYMRLETDHRPDYEFKQEWLDNFLIYHNKSEIAGVFEDRKQVVDMWRKNGLTCYQVSNGEY